MVNFIIGCDIIAMPVSLTSRLFCREFAGCACRFAFCGRFLTFTRDALCPCDALVGEFFGCLLFQFAAFLLHQFPLGETKIMHQWNMRRTNEGTTAAGDTVLQ